MCEMMHACIGVCTNVCVHLHTHGALTGSISFNLSNNDALSLDLTVLTNYNVENLPMCSLWPNMSVWTYIISLSDS